jgi:hypothetical protein
MTNEQHHSAGSDACMRAAADRTACERIEAFLMNRYGPVLDIPALTEVLRFNTSSALEKSIDRGHIALKRLSTPHRRGTFVLATDVANYLVSEAKN